MKSGHSLSRFNDRPLNATGTFLLVLVLFYIPLTQAEGFTFIDELRFDAPATAEKAKRIKLKKHPKVPKGRMAVIQGQLGPDDLADIFWLGKTPVMYRLSIAFHMDGAAGPIKAELVLKEKGTEKLIPLPESNGDKGTWVKAKGSIYLRVSADQLNKASGYSLFIWYPGEFISQISDKIFQDIVAAKPPVIKRLARRKLESDAK
ncbi:MAG: hypothetical protein GXP09_05135 [Gammaproteobacteria bacterium]|nr:hypothetical protein [Gammaproteobacteria bacterium]